jgi:hypothetical protein
MKRISQQYRVVGFGVSNPEAFVEGCFKSAKEAKQSFVKTFGLPSLFVTSSEYSILKNKYLRIDTSYKI